ncbi:hypothetical protein HKX48_006240 [Thoreauomyces humboldtii]|nr:hypothetical protein HKX48_006240 [Thoreauomyces humboldtii]
MRLVPVPRTRRIKVRHLAVATAVSTVVIFRKWLYCMTVVMHCFITWNMRSTNMVGTHDDGFPLDLLDLPPPPTVNATALLAAYKLVADARLDQEIPVEDVDAAQSLITTTTGSLKWGPETPESDYLVPPILHQIVLGMTGPVPQKWNDAAESCKALHPNWTFMQWDDAAAEKFIRKFHPWFLKTWLSYRYNIQKADSLRYLVLFTYGGTYIDMDIKCLRPLDPLRKFPFLANAAHPVGLSNGFIMAQPKDVFMGHLVENLELFDRFFISAYPTVMFSTGCMYISAQHAIYRYRNQLKVLGGDHNRLNGAATTPLFKHLGASSWHQGDAKLFVQIGKFLKAVPLFGGEGQKKNADGSLVVRPVLTVDPNVTAGASSTVVLFVLMSIATVLFALVFCYRRKVLRRNRFGGKGVASGAPCKIPCEDTMCCKEATVTVLVSEKEAWLME